MNARQKAKQYKKQLEQLKGQSYRIRIERTELVHYRTCYKAEPYERQDVVELHAKHKLWHDLNEVVNSFTEYDPVTEVFSFDFWVKK